MAETKKRLVRMNLVELKNSVQLAKVTKVFAFKTGESDGCNMFKGGLSVNFPEKTPLLARFK